MFGPIGEAKFIFLFLRNYIMMKDFLQPPDTRFIEKVFLEIFHTHRKKYGSESLEAEGLQLYQK